MMTFASALEDAQRYSKRHLLLGNGFSIACRPQIFLYGKLYENADFSKLSPTAKLAFEALGTQDFERVEQEPFASLIKYCQLQVANKKPTWQVLAERNGWRPPDSKV